MKAGRTQQSVNLFERGLMFLGLMLSWRLNQDQNGTRTLDQRVISQHSPRRAHCSNIAVGDCVYVYTVACVMVSSGALV